MTHPLIINLTGGLINEVSPGPNVTDENDLETWLRNHVGGDSHPMSTCKMGPPTDPMAVVDSTLRVYGIDNLRIVDASVIPSIVHGNIDQAVLLVALRGSQFILNQS